MPKNPSFFIDFLESLSPVPHAPPPEKNIYVQGKYKNNNKPQAAKKSNAKQLKKETA